LLLLAVLSACSASQPLNSERIESRFGNYAVRVLQQDTSMRISSLESGYGDQAVTRTLAITRFAEPDSSFADVAARISAGASIGAAFKNAGWTIDKPTLFIGTIELTADERIASRLMKIDLPASLATHAYRFEVLRNGQRYLYATITELHHPDYLREADLRRIYSTSLRGSSAEGAALRSAVRDTLLAMSISPAP
jgi:hypothetical protein